MVPLLTITDLEQSLQRQMPAGARRKSERLQRAWHIMKEAYEDTMHWSGETLEEHVLGVLSELMTFQPDEDTIIACLLHHVLASEEYTLVDIENEFGPGVRTLVSGAHLLSHVTVQDRKASIHDLRLMLLTVADDIRAVLMNLCDRLHILSHMSALSPEDRRRVCQDVLNLFAPVAARLGIYSMKQALEFAAFPVLYESDAERIAEQLDQLHSRQSFLHEAVAFIESSLQEQGIAAFVQAREKQPYSIFRKMQEKSLTHISDIYDLYALRIVVPDIETCYKVLGVAHRLGRPVANRFKDYISFPKPNGYRSLHTTLTHLPHVPDGFFIEMQIRTQDMHDEAEYGLAAHWSYKEKGSVDTGMDSAQLHRALASQEILDTGTAEQRLVDHIYALTPKGDIIELPEAATPLDFAFRVHSDLGLCFKGARVNGSMAAIDSQLENGDVVEILRHSTPRPSSQWLQILTVSSAKSRLRRFLAEQDRPELVNQGRNLFNEELRKRKLPVLDGDLSLLATLDGKPLTVREREDVLSKLAQGADRVGAILHRTALLQEPEELSVEEEVSEHVSRHIDDVHIEGGVPMPKRYALCCKPHEGSHGSITGLINRSGEIMIHRRSCGMLRSANPQRKVKVWW